jgi:hypothetical protein
MKSVLRFVLVTLMPLALNGCMATAGSSFEGKPVTGHSGCFSSAMAVTGPEETSIVLGSKTITIVKNELMWKGGGELKLPDAWARLDFFESGDSIVVNVDGNEFARVKPPKA